MTAPKTKYAVNHSTPPQSLKNVSLANVVMVTMENIVTSQSSCAGYLNVRQKSGKYKVADSQNSQNKVYRHFDSDSPWTLVQSYSCENIRHDNHHFPQLKNPLWKNDPVSENEVVWNAYRLSKARMESIKDNSTFPQFTCNYEKHGGINNKSDYAQIYLQNITKSSVDKNVDVIQLDTGDTYTEQSRATVGNIRGQIENCNLSRCRIQLGQNGNRSLHVHFSRSRPPPCNLNTDRITLWANEYFGSYIHKTEDHSCIKHQSSTTQLWFGVRNP